MTRKNPNDYGAVMRISHDTLAMVRGLCNALPAWTVQDFVDHAVRKEIKRMRVRVTPSSKARRGRPPIKKESK